MSNNFWQGEKIRLRGIEPSDAEIFFKWNMDSERARALDFVWPPISLELVKQQMEAQSKKQLENDCFHWVIEDLEHTPLGSISTHHCNPRDGTFSFGIDIAPEHRRKGYASEAILLVLKYYFEELRYQKVTVPITSYNEVSLKLHKHLGFIEEGRLRRTVYTRGQYFDTIWVGMTVEEFREKCF